MFTAADGEEGFGVALDRRPDVIVSEVAMPRTDGIELCRLIRRHAELRDTPIVLATGLRADSKSLAEGFSAGADDYLEMPCDPGRIVATVARLTERRRADLLLTDVVIPGMNGGELAHQVLARHPHVRVVCTSGYTECGIGDSRELGPDVVSIQKRFVPDVLLHAVRTVLGRN